MCLNGTPSCCCLELIAIPLHCLERNINGEEVEEEEEVEEVEDEG